MDKTLTELEIKINKFKLLQLPGQPLSMHLGTLYLVNDLWTELKKRAGENVGVNADVCPLLNVKRFANEIIEHAGIAFDFSGNDTVCMQLKVIADLARNIISNIEKSG